MDNYKETFETWNKVALLYQSRFMDLDFINPGLWTWTCTMTAMILCAIPLLTTMQKF